jgi:hypothetical protein
MATATGIPEQPTAASTEEEPLLGRPGDALQSEGQGLQYNFVIGTGSLAQAAIWIVSQKPRNFVDGPANEAQS